MLTPAHGLTWGVEGRRLIAQLAYERLTPRVRKAVDQLIRQAAAHRTPACPVASIEGASTWPDCVRATHDCQFAWLSPMHLEDPPLCGHQPKAAHCPDGRCLTEQTPRAVVVLRNPKRSSVERLEALEGCCQTKFSGVVTGAA